MIQIFEENDIDRVVHFAAESHVDRSIKNPDVFVKTNVLGTLIMLNAAKNAWELPDGTFKEGKKFLHVSTDEVYGSLGARTAAISMRQHPMHRTARIPQVRHLPTCW